MKKRKNEEKKKRRKKEEEGAHFTQGVSKLLFVRK
jgi:hypothetical protein